MSAPEEISVDDILKASAGMLQRQLYVILTRPTNGLGPVLDNLENHLAFQVKLEEQGTMFAAGPLWTDNEQAWRGEGMVVIRASSIDDARSIAASDPMHACGARTYEVRPWLINEGSITLKVRYSSQQVSVE